MPDSQHHSPAPGSAKQSVFEIYELNEAILLSLPASDILIAAVVCKSWHDVVTTSKAIRDHLLLAQTRSIQSGSHRDLASCFISTTIANVTLLLRRHNGLEVWALCEVWALRTSERCSVWVNEGPSVVKNYRIAAGWWILAPPPYSSILIATQGGRGRRYEFLEAYLQTYYG